MEPKVETPPARRGFLARIAAGLVAGLGLLIPLASGLAVFLDPLRRDKKKQAEARTYRVTMLESLPDDGQPRRFPIIADRRDAWSVSPNERLGAVYLRRLPGTDTVLAFNAVCPHAGCFIGYDQEEGQFLCPCHSSAFSLDGQIMAPSPSPRDMDSLPATVTSGGTVLVEFQNFYTGRPEKIAKS